MEKVAESRTAAFPWIKIEDMQVEQMQDQNDATSRGDASAQYPGNAPMGPTAIAAMRAAQHVQQLAVKNGNIPQSKAESAIELLMQQANANSGQHIQSNGIGAPQSELVKEEEKDSLLDSSPRKRTFSDAASQAQPMARKKKPRRADIDLDDEAINSDLDDSDDDALNSGNEAEGDDGDVQTVLCLYDKVARTKNKWKCVLKDGLVSLNGRDYAFSKANGEFEW